MKRHLGAAIAALALVLAGGAGSQLLAGPGTHTVTKPTAVSLSKVTPALDCPATSVTMQCVLAGQPPPPLAQLLNRGAPRIYGIDGYGPPSVALLRSIGAKFGAAYFSHTPGKNWTLSAVRAYHAAALGTVGVWETAANRAQEGPIAGAEDAMAYRIQAREAGDPNGPYRYAVDCDCSVASIAGYFRGADRADPGGAANTDGYGGYHQIMGLYRLGLVGHFNWATYAWSGSGSCECGPTLWPPASVAPLEQYLNGNAFDNDRGIAANYGQFPAPGKPVPARVHCFGPHAKVKTARCRQVRALTGKRSRARDATIRAISRRGCQAARPPEAHTYKTLSRWYPRIHKRPVRPCAVLRQRVIWFESKVHADLY